MAPPLAALLAAIALSAAAEPEGARVATVDPRGPLEDLALGSLPPPPAVVVRETRYYGNVTIDHRAHLARRAACRSCHGPGPVTKLSFTPKVAHERCIGCHKEEAKGPVACQGCHVKAAPKAPPQALAVAPPTAPPPPPGPNPANVASALAALEASAPPPGAPGAGTLQRSLEVGLAAADGTGPAVRLAFHQDRVLVTQSFDRRASADEARTSGLLGAGLSRPLGGRFALEALALGGFEVVERPVVALLPALGARAGVEWCPNLRFLRSVNASVTAVVDLATRRAGDREVGGAAVYGTVSTGFAIPPR